jgi:hypothetical protein
VPLTLEQHEKRLQEPALCEQLAVRDYLDDVVVRTNGSFVAGYSLKGLTSYFASDEGRNRGKLMMEALLRSIPEQSMRVQVRYEVLEDLGDLLDRYVAGQRSENPEAIALDAARVEQWRAKEADGHYIRPLSVLVSGAAQGHVANRRLSAIGRCFSIRSRRFRSAAGRVVGRGHKGSENTMKTISKAVASLHSSVARSKRLLAVLLVAVILAPTASRAQGIGDLLLLLHTITSTLQGPIGEQFLPCNRIPNYNSLQNAEEGHRRERG